MFKYFAICLVTSLFFGCSSNTIYVEKAKHKFSNNAIDIINSSDSTIFFKLKINDIFPMDYSDFKKSIAEIEKNTSKSTQLAAWVFTQENTFHSSPFSKESWQHNPVLFLNSIGGGYCDDRASVLAGLWRDHGDSSRVIGLEGHVVPEVYIDGKWQMYDPDNNIYFCDANGIVKSIEELESSTVDLLESQCNDPTVNPIFKFKNPISKRLAKLIISSDNNQEITQWQDGNQDILNEFSLPKHSSLEIIYDKETNITKCTVKLNSKSQGELNMPLVPFQASGKMNISTSDTVFIIAGDEVQFPRDKFYSKMDISNVEMNSEIQYLINPKLNFFQSLNKIDIQSTKPLEFESSIRSTSNSVVLFAAERLFLDQKTHQHKDFLSVISDYQSEKLDEPFLKEKYLLFLESDVSLSEQDRVVLMTQFDADYRKVFSDATITQHNFIQEHYPTSIFYLFLSSRYQKMDYVLQILNQQ